MDVVDAGELEAEAVTVPGEALRMLRFAENIRVTVEINGEENAEDLVVQGKLRRAVELAEEERATWGPKRHLSIFAW